MNATPVATALTSLAPTPASVERQRLCIASWRAAGLDVVAFQAPDEIAALTQTYDVQFVAAEAAPGSPWPKYAPICRMARWAQEHRAHRPVFLVNSDIELLLPPAEFARIDAARDGGLCWFRRWNHATPTSQDKATRERSGIDAFLFTGRDGALLPDSHLCMGQPWWDYWLPQQFLLVDARVSAVVFPAAFHQAHKVRWSMAAWQIAGKEAERSLHAVVMRQRIRVWNHVHDQIVAHSTPLPDAVGVVPPMRPPFRLVSAQWGK